MKKTYLYIILAAVVVIVAILILKNGNTSQKTASSPSVSPSISPTVSVSPSPKPKPSGGISVGIYDNLIVEYDGRRILLASDCRSANPSNVDFKNGTKIMLDNSLSSEARVIKIGSVSYNIPAGSWIFVTLTSKTLPVNLPMFCGTMELGQIGIIK